MKTLGVAGGLKGLKSLEDVAILAMDAFPKISDGINAYIVAIKNANGATGKFKATFTGLGAAMKANPIGAVVAVITIATIALKAYRNEQEKYQKSLQETISTADKNIQKYTEEKDTLLALQDKLEKSKDNKAQLLSIQSELNKAIGETPGLVQNEGNAYDIANEKIKARIKELDGLAKKEAQAKIDAQKEIFRTNTTPYKLGMDDLSSVGLNIDIQDAVDELNRLKAEKKEALNAGAKEDSVGITDYDKRIARYTQILNGKVEEAKEIFADYIDTEFNDDISKSYINKYIETLIFGGEDNLDNIQSKINEMKPKIEQFNNLKNDLLDFKVEGKNTDDIVLKIQGLIDEIKKVSPEVAELMQASYNSLIPKEDTITAGIEKIKEAYKKSLKPDDETAELQFNAWIDALSKEDKEIVYKISCDTDTAKYSLQDWQYALNDYKTNVESLPIRSKIKSLWDSEDFQTVQKSLIKMVNTVDGISAKKIKELAKESEELAEILELDGMSAEFLANIFENIALGNDGFSLITDDALKLNEVLNGMEDAFNEVTVAKKKYDEAMSSDEKDTNFKSLAEAFEVLNQQFVEGKTNSHAFWAASEFIFGSDKLKEFGYNIDKIYSAMAQNAGIFKDADSAGFGFLDKLYALSKSGQVLDKAGNVIAEIKKLSDGSYDIDIDYENIDKIADKMNLSREAVLSCLEAVSMFGDIDFYDIEEVAKVIEEIGISTEVAGKKAVNADALITQLVNLGKTEKEITDICEKLEGLGNITLIDAEMEVNDLITSIETLGMVSKDGATIEVEYTSLTDLMKEIGFTKEQAETLIKKLGEVDSVKFTEQLGSGSGGVTDVQGVLDHINTMDFSPAESEVDNVTAAVRDLNSTLNGLNGKSISVKIDIIGSVKDALGITGKYAKGTKGAAGGASLVGENGEELVQSEDKAYFVGTNGAEIVNLKPGDTVYTASETKKIKSSGKHFTGSIPAFSGGGTYGKVNNKKYNSVLPEKSSSKKSSSNKSKSEKEPQVFDWIEIALKRVQRAIDNLSKKAESIFKKLSTRLSATNEEILKINEEINLQQKAADRYMKEANKVGLSSDLAKKVREGTVDINKYDEDTKKLIEDYEKWYQKSLDCTDVIADLHEELASLYEDNFNNVKDDYENQLSLYEHLTNTYETGIDLLDAKGYMASTKYYAALQDAERTNIAIRKKEFADLEKQFSAAMNSGEIDEYSESWYGFQISMNEVKEAIAESEVKLAEFAKTMREIEWERFDYVQDRIGQITQESDFLIDLMSNKELYDDKGQLNNEGMVTMGLHGQNYNVYMAQADQYAQEILSINEQLAKDPNNTELIARKEELLGLQQDTILAAEDEKKAIVSLVEEGINRELDALRKLIDTYSDALDNAKSLYDYQNKVSEKADEIASLQKQLSAYKGDNSEETRAIVQKLEVDLSKAQEDLAKTEYEQFISDQKKLLDELYTEYETILNQRLDDVELLISDMIDQINLNADSINDTLITTADSVGYTMSDNMQKIWDGSTNAIDGVITKYGDKFDQQFTAVNSVLNSISVSVASMVSESEKQATDTIKNTKPTTEPSKPTSNPKPTTPKPAEKKVTIGGKINAKGAKIYSDSYGGGKQNQYYANDPIYTVLGENNGYWKVRYHKLSSGVTGWFKKGDVKAYKTGGLVDYTGLAQLDGTPGKPELILNSKDTQNFIELRDALRTMASQPLTIGNSYDGYVPAFSGLTDISGKLASISGAVGSVGTTFGDFNITIPIEHVEDYNDFVTQLQRDPKFEQMIQAMTTDILGGGSPLSKYKYHWK